MTQVQLQQLQKQLWNIANTLRGTMGVILDKIMDSTSL